MSHTDDLVAEIVELKAENKRLRDMLMEIMECPKDIVTATVPKKGMEVVPEQVVYNMSIGLLRIRKAMAILETKRSE